MEIIKKNTKIGLYAALVAILTVVYLLTTNPQTLSPVLLIIPFVLFFVLVSLSGAYIVSNVTQSGQSLSRKRLFLIVLCSGYPVFLLLLQSVGQLSIRDFITLSLLLMVSGFYILKSNLGTLPDK
ncbi:MAG TPA: hypothetical protein VMR95_04330 [Candidatus Binatia bacterium]|jgi:choline-glycine betaine transporter|nr:hypothetical protein [Candidatus Binatia bacterium]